MAKPMIEIEIESGKEEEAKGLKGQVESEIESAVEEEDQGFLSLLAGIQLSPKASAALVTGLNKVLPLFGIPSVSGKGLSADVARGLAMISQAITDASASDEAPMELVFSLEDLQGGDQAAMVVAGKLDRLSRTPSFKKFLKSKSSMPSPSEMPPAGDEMAMEKTEEQGPSIEALFASRM